MKVCEKCKRIKELLEECDEELDSIVWDAWTDHFKDEVGKTTHDKSDGIKRMFWSKVSKIMKE